VKVTLPPAARRAKVRDRPFHRATTHRAKPADYSEADVGRIDPLRMGAARAHLLWENGAE
jgi:hypothetical protein